jgi:hypothetical protein
MIHNTLFLFHSVHMYRKSSHVHFCNNNDNDQLPVAKIIKIYKHYTFFDEVSCFKKLFVQKRIVRIWKFVVIYYSL